MSRIYSTSPLWPGLAGINHFIIFGDSFSSIGYGPGSPPPSFSAPLGVAWPGATTCTAPARLPTLSIPAFEPNWVGHLVEKRRSAGHALVVHDYAVGGARVEGVGRQVREFVEHVGGKPGWARWTAGDAMFVTWVGANDCRLNQRSMPESNVQSMDSLFDLQEELYEAGARHFCLIEVAPVYRFPLAPKGKRNFEDGRQAYTHWNELLHTGAASFGASHPDATVVIFGACGVVNRILDAPACIPLPVPRWGADWADAVVPDGIHLASGVHERVAAELEKTLVGMEGA